MPHGLFHRGGGVLAALPRLALGVMLVAPVDVVLVDPISVAASTTTTLLDHQDRPLRRVGDCLDGGLVIVWGAQIAQHHLGGVASLGALVEDGVPPFGRKWRRRRMRMRCGSGFDASHAPPQGFRNLMSYDP